MTRAPIILRAALVLGTGASLLAQTRITTASGGGERQPVINADGTVVAYVAFVGNVREVFTISPEGGTPTRRTTNAEVRIGATTVFDAWPSLSISDDGTKIAYWNAGGVHVLDTVANSDVVVDAAANVLAYPQLNGDGSRVVYQAQAGGAFEVFVAPSSGGGRTQLSTTSGAGRRLPHIRGSLVAFQRLVGNFQEVFVHDLSNSTTSGPLTTSSGRGNRYARLDHGATSVVYEALLPAGSVKEAFVYQLATATRRQLTSSSLRGDRLAVPTLDGEAFFEANAQNREVARVDLATSASSNLTTGTRAGYRRISVDRHGSVAVYQGEQIFGPQLGNTEVFVLRLCYVPSFSSYGVAGTPSQGVVTNGARARRCDIVSSLDTSLPAATPAVALLGVTQLSLPIPGAPGNSLYVDPSLQVAASLDAQGNATLTLPSPIGLSGSAVFLQWALLDPPANALGLVTSSGTRVQLQ